jgi:hypothetical protein
MLPSQLPPWLPTGQEAATGLGLAPPPPARPNTDQLLETAGGASALIASTRFFTLPACSAQHAASPLLSRSLRPHKQQHTSGTHSGP